MSFDGTLANVIIEALRRATESLSHKQLKELCCEQHKATDAGFICTLTELAETGQITKCRKPVGYGMLRKMTDCYDLAKVLA